MISRLSHAVLLSRRELVALAVVFGISLPAVTARLYSSDEVEYYSYLRSIWFDRDVSFENEYRYFYDRHIAQSEGYHETFLERETEIGRRINFATIGCAILWAPFYGVADVAARVARRMGRDVAVDGFSRPYVTSVAYASAFYGFLAIVLSIRAARLITGEGFLPGILVWLGTPLLFYMYVAPPMSHATSAFSVALFVTAWLYARQTWSPWRVFVLGLTAALMAMVREQDAFFAFGPGVDFLLARPHGTRRARQMAGGLARLLLTAGGGVVAFIIGYLPQLLAYDALNGRPRPSSLVTRKMTWTAPHAGQVLASPEHGFLCWTPLAALAIIGLVALAFRPGDPDARRVGWCALLMIALQIYISGSVESWTVAGAFGQRRFVAVTALLTIGLAELWRTTRRPAATLRHGMEWRRGALLVIAAVCVWWNVALMAQFGAHLMDRQRLELGRNAYHAFVTLPRIAPQLAYRYFTDRSSFYEPRPEP